MFMNIFTLSIKLKIEMTITNVELPADPLFLYYYEFHVAPQ